MFHSQHPPASKPRRALGIMLLGACAHALGETWVVTDRAHPITDSNGVRVIFLDEQERLEEQLTQQLPSNLSQAPETIQSYLSSSAGINFQHDLTQAQQGTTDAWSLGIEKIPAVIVDRRFVVYGEADVKAAVEKIERFRNAQP
ncbi:TIGR03757 family integrating conjugative element protein [Pseudomonas sp. UBA1879]|uniref:TIGR03757 family integrating conjugative element protein n=1 Tax=Pseudomonas sp. UBA1879 TaxID=1947305 RepID=UPI0025CF003D|nr:TIGR03757 family integrating conjugative element protein [Pseudomonas sp. UBA1879]